MAITGPNGGGKSTMAKIIAGIYKPTAGRILLDGEDITDLDITQRAQRGISFAFQQPVRFKGLTVKDLITLASGKNIDVLCERFAQSIESGRRCEELPRFRDAAVASEYAWKFIHDARTHDLPAIGDLRTLQQIRERRRTMKNGYGLLRKRA